ncbi:hypothetical protein ACP5YT_004073, partial [Cronobacter malonaticus]
KKQPYIRKIECVKVSDDAVTLVYVRYFPGKIHVCYRDPTLPFFGSQQEKSIAGVMKDNVPKHAELLAASHNA